MSSFRITTNGLFRDYRNGLFTSKKTLSAAMKRVETHRALNSYAEDPSKASQAFQRRRDLWRTNDQITNNNYIFSKYSSAYAALQDIVDGNDNQPGLDGIKDSLEVLNDPDAGGRKALGQSLMEKADSIMHVMNITYGTDFVFGGADAKNVPFSWGSKGELLYHGVDVTCDALIPTTPGNINVKLDEDVSVKSLKDFPKLDEDKKPVMQNKQYTDDDGNLEFTYVPRIGAPQTVYQIKDDKDNPSYQDENGNALDVTGGELLPNYVQETDSKGNFVYSSNSDGKDVTVSPTGTQMTSFKAGTIMAVTANGDLAITDVDTSTLNLVPIESENAFDKAGNRILEDSKGNQYVRLTNEQILPAIDMDGQPHYNVERDLTIKYEQEMVYDPEAYEQYKADAIVQGKALLAMADEHTYIDLGLGMKRDVDGELLDSSAFDSALCGMKFLGYGVDEEGDPQNMIVLMHRLGELANSCDANTGEFPPNSGGLEEASRLAGKLRDAIARVSEQHVNLAAKSEYLEDNGEILDQNKAGLNEQITELEDVDPVDAITQMLYAQYCYNAALRIGSDILSQSLIDYMR